MPREIFIPTDDELCDLQLTAASQVPGVDGGREIGVRGLHGGESVGFSIILLPRWTPWEIEGLSHPLERGGVLLRRDGAEGDAFVRALDDVYRTRQRPHAMRPRVFFAAIALAGRPVDIEREAVKLKLFHEADFSRVNYAEVFLNVDLVARRIELREKDPEYRGPLVRALAESREP